MNQQTNASQNVDSLSEAMRSHITSNVGDKSGVGGTAHFKQIWVLADDKFHEATED